MMDIANHLGLLLLLYEVNCRNHACYALDLDLLDMIAHEVLMVQTVCMVFHNIGIDMSMGFLQFLVNNT